MIAAGAASSRDEAFRIRCNRSLSQARTRRRFWPTALRTTLARVAVTPLEIAAAEVPVGLHVTDHGLDSRAAAELALDHCEDAALLVRDEDAARVFGFVAAIALVDIGALDRTAGERLGAIWEPAGSRLAPLNLPTTDVTRYPLQGVQ